MKKILIPSLAFTALAASSAVQAQPLNDTTDRFSLSYRMAFNVGVKFKNLGGFAAQTDPGPATGGLENRRYDDGYNLVDNNNNSYGDLQATRNWGYLSPDQVQNGQFIVMHSSSAAPLTSTPNRDSEPHHGFELAYQHEFGRRPSWRWGIEGAFNYMPISVTDRATYAAPVSRVNDAFEVPPDEEGFRFIPTAPYSGSNAEGPLLGSSPVRTVTTVPNGAIVTGSRSFDADLFGFKLGGYLDFPLDDKWRVTLSGGLALVAVDSEFSYNDTMSIAGAGAQTRQGSGTNADRLLGGYVTGSVTYAVGPDWQLFTNVQWQNVGRYTHNLGGPAAVLDLGQTIFVGLGAVWSF